MLVLSRAEGESIVVDNDVTITVLEIRGNKVRLGVIASRDVPVHRFEVQQLVEQQRREKAATP